MIIYIVKANNETCKNGFQAEKECLSATHPLQQQLDQTREDLRRIKAQAATCNQTVANNETCKNGFQAEKECLSATHPLQQQLDQTREDLRRIKAQAATCNQTVETLKASLEAEKVHSQEKQDQVQELQGEIMNLVQKLQSTWAEVEQLRRLSETSGGETTSTSNQKKVSPFLVTGLLLLGLRALLS
ncbi:Bone Marrow Stromal Antigen 2 [Manis pentadactyla]|nr:Bone Marrow Stromal Antigen 2 [Manis pentadactyla]